MECSGLAGLRRGSIILGHMIWGFPKNGGTFLGIPIIRIIAFWGLYWGPLILGNYHVEHASGLCFPVFSLKNVS